MKFVIYLLALALCFLFFEQTLAQCRRAPRNPSCSGRRDSGRRGIRCRRATRWYYNPATRSCNRFRYNGCRGNDNRWCSLAACQRRCVPRG